MAEFIDWLQAQHDKVMGIEKEAYELMRKDDIAGYRQKMAEKAQILAGLARDAKPQLAGLPRRKANMADDALQEFSANAQTALQLNSVFYMSSLLYKDEHKSGEPDNLQLFIDEFKK